MLGYHYTSAKNYEQIKEEGLIPCLLTHPGIIARSELPRHGIWVYRTRQSELSHEGCLKWQATIKRTY